MRTTITAPVVRAARDLLSAPLGLDTWFYVSRFRRLMSKHGNRCPACDLKLFSLARGIVAFSQSAVSR